jgi:hypothetical protein
MLATMIIVFDGVKHFFQMVEVHGFASGTLVLPPAKAVLLNRNNLRKHFLTSQEMLFLRECSEISFCGQ